MGAIAKAIVHKSGEETLPGQDVKSFFDFKVKSI